MRLARSLESPGFSRGEDVKYLSFSAPEGKVPEKDEEGESVPAVEQPYPSAQAVLRKMMGPLLAMGFLGLIGGGLIGGLIGYFSR